MAAEPRDDGTDQEKPDVDDTGRDEPGVQEITGTGSFTLPPARGTPEGAYGWYDQGACLPPGPQDKDAATQTRWGWSCILQRYGPGGEVAGR